MKVKILASGFVLRGKKYEKGKTYEIDEKQGKRWIAYHIATEVVEKKKKVEKNARDSR